MCDMNFIWDMRFYKVHFPARVLYNLFWLIVFFTQWSKINFWFRIIYLSIAIFTNFYIWRKLRQVDLHLRKRKLQDDFAHWQVDFPLYYIASVMYPNSGSNAEDMMNMENLVYLGYEVDKFNPKGESILTYCARIDNAAMIRYLLRAGFDANAYDALGQLPLNQAIRFGNRESIEEFLPERQDGTPASIYFSPLKSVVDVNAQSLGGYKMTPLHLCALKCDVATAERLIMRKADVNIRARHGDLFHMTFDSPESAKEKCWFIQKLIDWHCEKAEKENDPFINMYDFINTTINPQEISNHQFGKSQESAASIDADETTFTPTWLQRMDTPTRLTMMSRGLESFRAGEWNSEFEDEILLAYSLSPENVRELKEFVQMKYKYCRECGRLDEKENLVAVCGCLGDDKQYMHLECFRRWYSNHKHWWRLQCNLCKGSFREDVLDVILEVYKEKLARCNYIFPWPDESNRNYMRDYQEDSFNEKQQATFLRQMAVLLGKAGDRERQTEFLKEALKIKRKALQEKKIKDHEVRSLERYLKFVDQWDDHVEDLQYRSVDKEVTVLWRCVQDCKRLFEGDDCPEMIKVLLQGKADPNHECCPLFAAAEYNVGSEVINVLLAHDADINIRDRYGHTLLEIIAIADAGLQKNTKEWEKSTRKKVASAQFLLDIGFDLQQDKMEMDLVNNTRTIKGSVLDYMLDSNNAWSYHPDVIEVLKHHKSGGRLLTQRLANAKEAVWLKEKIVRSDSKELTTYSNKWDEWDAFTQEHRQTRFTTAVCVPDEWCCMNDEGGCINISRMIKEVKLKDNGLMITRIVIAVQTVIDHYSDAILAFAWFLQGRYAWFGLWLGCNFLSTFLPGCLLLLYGQPLWIAFPMFFGFGMAPLIYKVYTSRDDGRLSRKYRISLGEMDIFSCKAERETRNVDRLKQKYRYQQEELKELYTRKKRLQRDIQSLREEVRDIQSAVEQHTAVKENEETNEGEVANEVEVADEQTAPEQNTVVKENEATNEVEVLDVQAAAKQNTVVTEDDAANGDVINQINLSQKSHASHGSSSWCTCFFSSKSGNSTVVDAKKVEPKDAEVKYKAVEIPEYLKRKNRQNMQDVKLKDLERDLERDLEEKLEKIKDFEKDLDDMEVEIKFLMDKIKCTIDVYKCYLNDWIQPYENYFKKFDEKCADKQLENLLVSFKRECDCLHRLGSHCDSDMFKGHKELAENFELLEHVCDERLFRLNIANLDRSTHSADKALLVKRLKEAFLSACANNPRWDEIGADIEAEISDKNISWTSEAFADPDLHIEYKALRKALSEDDILLNTFEYNERCLDNLKWIKSRLTKLDRTLASIIFELNFPDIYKLWEVTTESLPQLFLQIYVLLVGELSGTQILGISGDVILYGSLFLSFISNVLGTTRMFEPRGCRLLSITILYGVFDTAWRGFSLCIPLSNSEYSYVIATLTLVFVFINGIILGNFFIRRTELQLSHGSIRMWFGSFFLGAILFLCATPVIFLVSSSGVDPSVSFVNWAFSEAAARLLSGLLLLAFSDWEQRYMQIIITIICGFVSVALLWTFPNLIASIPRNNILLDPFGHYQKKKAEYVSHSRVLCNSCLIAFCEKY